MSFTASLDEIVAGNGNGLLSIHPSWTRVRLREVAEILSGCPFDSNAFSVTDGFPLIRIRDVVRGSTQTFFAGEYEQQYVMHLGDLLIGMDGDFNSARWAGPPALLNQRVCRITTDDKRYDLGFLTFALPGYLKAINDNTPSITVKHLSTRTIADIPLPFPPLPEQRRIVAKIEELFSDLDAGVAALERVRANLKRYRAAVLKAAVEGRLTEEWRTRHPTTEPAAKLLERILAERRAKWEQDQLRKFKEAGKTPPKGWKEKYKEPPYEDKDAPIQIPASWRWASADQLAEFVTDGDHNPPPRVPTL
jgi:type I restriction enzyme S subunit